MSIFLINVAVHSGIDFFAKYCIDVMMHLAEEGIIESIMYNVAASLKMPNTTLALRSLFPGGRE